MTRDLLSRATLVLRPILKALLVMLGVLVLVFTIMRFAPGDPISTLLGEGASNQDYNVARQRLGLDLPVWKQLFQYLTNVATGDFGMSIVHRRPAIDVVLQAFPATMLLGSVAFAIAVMLAVPMGIASAVWREETADRVIGIFVLIAQTVPPFWGGIMLIHIFSLNLHLLPTSGTGSWQHIILPAVTLALYQVATIIRTLRSSMLEVLKEDYIRTARAKGLGRWRIILRHGLGNALGPVITILGLQLGAMFSGAIVTEAVFAWPGLGSLGLGALLTRDYTLAQAVVAFTAMLVVAFNLLADALVSFIDPRIRDSALSSRNAGGR